MKIGLVDAVSRSGALTAALRDAFGAIGTVTPLTMPADEDDAGMIAFVKKLAAGECDRYILHATEVVAERLAAVDVAPLFIVPGPDWMSRPDRFWQQFVRHNLLCFSRPLSERLQRLSCTAAYFQYFPETTVEACGSDPGAATFAEDRPSAVVSLQLVIGLACDLGLRRLSVSSRHRQPFTALVDGIEVSVRPPTIEARNPALFHFVTDRPVDGADVAHAMAAGRIIVAPAGSLAADYCADLVSGLLYAPSVARLSCPDEGMLAAMSRAARRKAVNGRRDWAQDIGRLQSIVGDDGKRWSTSDCSAHFNRTIRMAAHHRAWYG